jgi:hypothetical protein
MSSASECSRSAGPRNPRAVPTAAQLERCRSAVRSRGRLTVPPPQYGPTLVLGEGIRPSRSAIRPAPEHLMPTVLQRPAGQLDQTVRLLPSRPSTRAVSAFCRKSAYRISVDWQSGRLEASAAAAEAGGLELVRAPVSCLLQGIRQISENDGGQAIVEEEYRCLIRDGPKILSASRR